MNEQCKLEIAEDIAAQEIKKLKYEIHRLKEENEKLRIIRSNVAEAHANNMRKLAEENERLKMELKIKDTELKSVNRLGVKYQQQRAKLIEGIKKAQDILMWGDAGNAVRQTCDHLNVLIKGVEEG